MHLIFFIKDQFSLEVDKILGIYIIYLIYSSLLSCITRFSDDIFEGKRRFIRCIYPRMTHLEWRRSSRANCINSPLSIQKRNTRVGAFINLRRATSYRRSDLRLASQCRVLIGADVAQKGPRRTDVTGPYDAYRRVSELSDNFRKIIGWHANVKRYVRVWNCVSNRLDKSVIRSQTIPVLARCISACYSSIKYVHRLFLGERLTERTWKISATLPYSRF